MKYRNIAAAAVACLLLPIVCVAASQENRWGDPVNIQSGNLQFRTESSANSSPSSHYVRLWWLDADQDNAVDSGDGFYYRLNGGSATSLLSGLGTVTGTGTDNHPMRWDGTGAAQDVANWTYADTSGKMAWTGSLNSAGVIDVTNSGTTAAKAIIGAADGATGINFGVYGSASSTSSGAAAVKGVADGGSGEVYGGYFQESSSDNAAYSMYAVNESYLGTYADVAEGTVPATPPSGAGRHWSSTTSPHYKNDSGLDMDIGSGYAINFMCLSYNPANGGTDFMGANPIVPAAASGTRKIFITRAGTLTAADLFTTSSGVPGGQDWSFYVRLNNTTDYLIETKATSAGSMHFTNSAMNSGSGITLAAGDYIEIKTVNPTWSPGAPTAVTVGGYLLIQ